MPSDDSSEEEPTVSEAYHYARGTFRRLAEEEYHQPRQRELHQYWNRPSGEDVVEEMMEKGWGEELAREGVKKVWDEQRTRMDKSDVKRPESE